MKLKKSFYVSLGFLVILGLNNLLNSTSPRISLDEYLRADANASITPEKYHRPLNQTLLSFPEWYLVFSPTEYAVFIKENFSNQFPFFGHTLQFWHAYYQVADFSNQLNYSNIPYHFMNMVIGVSTSIEYILRGIYEQTIGALSASVSGRVAEDDFAAIIAQEYVDFINKQPWYEFDFGEKINKLWSEVPFDFNGVFRKIERRFALTTEYLFKMIYAKIIRFGTKTTYEEAEVTTAVMLQKEPKVLPKNTTVISKFDKGKTLVSAPRLQPFTNFALKIARDNNNMLEISGNKSIILLSILSPDNKSLMCKDCITLFQQNILTTAHLQRTVILVPISKLSQVIRELSSHKFDIEHIYDF